MSRDLLHLHDKAFWKQLLAFGLPMALQQFVSTSLNVTDNLMIGQLGEKAIGALALANQISFLVILFTYGVGSGAAVFASQYWGAKDLRGVRFTQGFAYILAIGSSLIFAALG